MREKWTKKVGENLHCHTGAFHQLDGAAVYSVTTERILKKMHFHAVMLAQQSLDGTVTPAVFMPDRRWSPDAPGLQVITELLGTLGASQVIAGIGLTDLAAVAPPRRAHRLPGAGAGRRSCPPSISTGSAPAGPTSPACGRRSPSTRQTSDPEPGARSAGPRAGRRRFHRVPVGSGGRRGEPGDGGGHHRRAPHRGADLLRRQLVHAGVVDVAAGADRAEQPAVRRAGAGADHRRRAGRADRHRPRCAGGPGGSLAAGQDPRRGLQVGAVPGQRATGRRGRHRLGPPVQLSVESTAYGALTGSSSSPAAGWCLCC